MSRTSIKNPSAVTQARPEWASARRIVVKIGSALLADRATGTLKTEWLSSLMDDVAALAKSGKDIVLVSSGAIALGRHTLKLPKGPLELALPLPMFRYLFPRLWPEAEVNTG